MSTRSLRARPLPIELDVSTTAVVVVDMQKGFVSPGGSWSIAGVDTTPLAALVPAIAAVLDAARQVGVPVVYVTMPLPPEPDPEGIDRYRGRKINTTGDGVLATFDGPARAVQCATAICEGVTALGLRARAGVHIGEIELRGADIGGVAVHVGARIAAAAGPGEVLVSRTITDLVAGSGLDFEDRGEHVLKGVDAAQQLFAVVR